MSVGVSMDLTWIGGEVKLVRASVSGYVARCVASNVCIVGISGCVSVRRVCDWLAEGCVHRWNKRMCTVGSMPRKCCLHM